MIGGGEQQSRALAENLAARGHEVTVMTRRTDSSHAAREMLNGVRVWRLGPTGRRRRQKWGFLLIAWKALARSRDAYDVVLVSGFRIVGVAAVSVCRRYGKTCILKADSLGEMSGAYFRAGLARLRLRPSSPMIRTLLRWRNDVLRDADAFVAISTAVAAEIETTLSEGSTVAGPVRDRIYRIPNGVDTNRFIPADIATRTRLREALGLPATAYIVAYTGRIVSYKGLPTLLRAWERLARKEMVAHLLLVGEGGLDIHNCEAALRALVSEGVLVDRVSFAGRVDDVERYLQSSDAFVLPSESEAFGISLIEAMACGLPVIASRVGGMTDIVDDGRTGLFVEPGDEETLLRALETLIGNPEHAAEMGAAARRETVDRFSEEAVTNSYEALIEQLSIADAGGRA